MSQSSTPCTAILLLAGLWLTAATTWAQPTGLPGVSSPGVMPGPGGCEVCGTGLALTRTSVAVDVGGGKTVTIPIGPRTLCSVKGRAEASLLFVGARVQVTGHLSRNPQVIHDASVTLFVSDAVGNSASGGNAVDRDPSWLQFTGTVVSVVPLVVQADRQTRVGIELAGSGRHLSFAGVQFEVQIGTGRTPMMFVEFGTDVGLAGERPTVRSFVNDAGVASYVTITRTEPLTQELFHGGAARPAAPAAKLGKEKDAKVAEDKPERAKAKKAAEADSERPKRPDAKERFKAAAFKNWRGPRDGSFLLAHEELSGDGLNIEFVVADGLDAAVENISAFMFADRPTRRKYQIVAWFPAGEPGAKLANLHRAKLHDAIGHRLKDAVFSRDPCYSDLNPSSGKSINQGVAEGTCVIYYPLR